MRQSDEHPKAREDIPDTVWNIQVQLGDPALPEGIGFGENPSFDELAEAIEKVTLFVRDMAAQHVLNDQLWAYWNNGRMIVVYEQNGSDRAEYGDQTLTRLARRLTAKQGKGFSRANLYNMRLLYLTHQDFQELSGRLSWSHYCELITLEDGLKRKFYEHEAANSGWSVRELRRQMNSMLFERILNAKDDARREYVLALANEGVTYSKPADAIRNPLVLEFLDLPDDVTPKERDLQQALVSQIEKFMLELGRGFMFVGSNVRVPVGYDNDFADMVFYCKPLRAYVLIELKTDKLMSSAVGQINEYLNYYATEVNDEYDNPPIGIILCTDKNNVRVQYALGGLSNAVFASTYTLRLPDEGQLEDQVRRTIEANERKALMSGEEDA